MGTITITNVEKRNNNGYIHMYVTLLSVYTVDKQFYPNDSFNRTVLCNAYMN